MQATKQQQIIGYFIEEAKEHLDTIEQGLLDLQNTMADPERRNELFRAAHSVKGGAAMLGFDSIQHVSHHLEDCFKILKDQPVHVDQNLESLFLQGFDTLKELVERLQSPYGLREEEAKQMVKALEPTFVELETSLNRGIQGNRSVEANLPVAAQPATQTVANLPALLNNALKMMLQLFKQGDTPNTRQQLATLCSRMTQLSSSREWHELLKTTHKAITNSKNSFSTLAPIVIKDLKQAGDLLAASRTSQIAPSQPLLQLAQSATPTSVAAPQPVAVPSTSISAAATATREQVAVKPQQILIPAEPRAAARALLNAFNKEQLIELAEFLMKAIQ